MPFKHDMTQRGWKLLEDVDEEPPEISIRDLEFVSYLRPREHMIGGPLLLERSQELGAKFGQIAAELLLPSQRTFPADWRICKVLFPKTVWLDCDGNRRIPGWRWEYTVWRIYFPHLGNAFFDRDHVGVLRPRARLF